MNPILLQFLKDYLEWVEDGAIEPNFYFARNNGLCTMVARYARRNEISSERANEVEYDFHMLLAESFTNPTYPFNDNRYNYQTEALAREIHLNEKRINWVKEKIANA